MVNEKSYACTSHSPERTKALGEALAALLEPGDAVVLNGDLGAGKTQFVQGAARALGIAREVTSPTFNILATYEDGTLPLNHFDLYRLEDPEQLEDIGYWEALEAGAASFIEWGDRFPDCLPDDYLELAITADAQGARTLTARAHGPRAEVLLDAWERRIAELPDEAGSSR